VAGAIVALAVALLVFGDAILAGALGAVGGGSALHWIARAFSGRYVPGVRLVVNATPGDHDAGDRGRVPDAAAR
jgi:hypothetical protein